MKYFEFNKYHKEIKEIKEGSFYFFRMLYVKSLLVEADIEVDIFFINNKEDLKTNTCIDTFAGYFFQDTSNNFVPVIIIGNEDLIIGGKDYDRRQMFLDSSIWIYYVGEGNKGNKREKDIEKAVKYIKKNYENKLYNINVAKEFVEFNGRIVRESKLQIKGAHADDVSPFVFHSERNMKDLADQELEKITKLNLKWRFLLIDDFANTSLSGDGIIKNKTEYIKVILAKDGLIKQENKEQENNDCNKNDNSGEGICIEIATDINSAINKISKKTYDIILLDYLLGEKNRKREYGDKFIENIKEGIEKAQSIETEQNTQSEEKEIPEFVNKIGPLNRFWIFPISSFSTAMIDKIRERGIGHLDKHWYIPRGADPLNTPQLFRYNLYRFMNMQIEELLNYNNIEFAGSKDYLIHIIEKLYKDYKKKNNKNADKFAVKIYPELILIHSKLQELSKDEEHDSLFAKSVIKKYYNPKQEKKWQHVLHLFYLLSSHGYLKSPEMWKELNSIKQTADNTEKLKKQKWYKNVNNYIAELYNKIN